MPSLLATTTEITKVADNLYDTEARPAASIVDGLIHGGVILQLAARAMQDATGVPHPITITGHFLAAVRPGPLTIATEVLRRGRHTTARALIRKEDATVALTATATFTDLTAAPGETRRLSDRAPELPEVDDCFEWPIPGKERSDKGPNVMELFEHRLDKESFGWARGEPSGKPSLQAWARPNGGEWDPLDLITLTDVYFPPIFGTGIAFTWVPTIELTVQLRTLPQGNEWLACRFESRELTGGYLEEDGEIRAEDGRLVAISRQLALMPKR